AVRGTFGTSQERGSTPAFAQTGHLSRHRRMTGRDPERTKDRSAHMNRFLRTEGQSLAMLGGDALLQQRPNDSRHTVGRRARWKKPEILPSSVHQINVAGMVDRIVIAGRRNLGIIDFVRTGGLRD